MKATTKEREEMRRTQPKMCRLINGFKGGKGRMVIVEPSDVQKEKLAKLAEHYDTHCSVNGDKISE